MRNAHDPSSKRACDDRMTCFLASVLDAQEAEIAIAGGADVIDFKNPHEGALGALDVETIKRGVQTVAGRQPTSATAGDWAPDAAGIVDTAMHIGQTGVDVVKIGLMPGQALINCLQSLRVVTQRYRLVVVLYADLGVPMAAIDTLAAIGCTGVLIDTFDKSAGRLRKWGQTPFLMTDSLLREFVVRTHDAGMLAGLAGSLRTDDIEPLFALKPDIMGFRSALCDQFSRTQAIKEGKVRAVRAEFNRVLGQLASEREIEASAAQVSAVLRPSVLNQKLAT